MKLLRKMNKLELALPTCKPTKELPSLKDARFPMHAAYTLCQQLDQINSSGAHDAKKRTKHLLLEKHKELFDIYPDAGTPIAVVKARCVYRLQYLGHEQTGIEMPAKALANYKAMMRFKTTFEGCSRDVAEVGTLISISEGEVSMSSVKAVKKVTKAKKGKVISSASKHVKVFDEYSVAGAIRWLADRCKCSTEQVRGVIKSLGLEDKIAASTVVTVMADQRSTKYRKDPPTMKAEHAEKLRKLIPAREIKKAVKKVSQPSAVKKVVKKVKK